MDRKRFLSSVVPLLSVGGGMGENMQTSAENPLFITPPYLKKGDLIGITSPGGFISMEDIQPCVQKMEQWGFRVKVGKTIGTRHYSMGGTDEIRRDDFQEMLNDTSVKAIMCARGGYGVVRIIDKLIFKEFRRNPKWIVGFSDVTVFHSHLSKKLSIASIHAKMCNSFPADWCTAEPIQIESIESIRKCLTGEKMHYNAEASEYNRAGISEGRLTGGNLSILENLSGTPSDINTDGNILFIEEVGEYLYSIDRMLWNLKRTAKLQNLKGLVIGGFNRIKTDEPGEEFGKTIYEMINEKVKPFQYPVCFDFPVGHQKNNFALKCGIQ